MSYHYKYNKTLVAFAQAGRKNKTDAEKLLWYRLRNRQLQGLKFRRQYPMRNYILDFYCEDIKLAIELDGSQHQQRKFYDEKRSEDLRNLGIKVIRFWDNEVLIHTDSVLEQILRIIETLSIQKPHPTLSRACQSKRSHCGSDPKRRGLQGKPITLSLSSFCAMIFFFSCQVASS